MKKGYFCIQNQRKSRCFVVQNTIQMQKTKTRLCSFGLNMLALLGLASLSCDVLEAQEVSGYGYLEFPVSPRSLALGGTSISVVEPEMSVVEQNPALLCPEMSGQLALSYMSYVSDINLGYAGFAGKFLDLGGWSVGMRYADYGDFDGYTEEGIHTGQFGVKDMCLEGAVGYPVNDNWRIGAQMKMMYTSYESYSAFAMGVDLGINYYNDVTGNSFSITATNLGTQLKALYDDGRKQHLPSQINVGWSKDLLHLPFTVSVTGYHLLDWDQDYVDGNGQKHTYKDSEMVLNHLIFGIEWSALEHFWLAASYNYRNQSRFRGQGGFLRGVGLGAGLRYNHLSFQIGYASTNAADGSLAFQFGYTF